MPFLLTNALFLAGLAGLAVPVLIHLLLKRRTQKLRFSTLRFFRPQDTRSTSRRRLRNLLLLLLRLAIFALIVLAFARPYLPRPTGAAGRPPRQLVVVLDRSLSLTARDASGSRWEAALKAARGALAALGDEDRAALVGLSGRPEVLSGFAPVAAVARKLAELAPLPATADVGDGLREATRLVAASDPRFESSVLVVGDLQRSGMEGLASAALPAGLGVKFLPVGDPGAPNVAVTDLRLDAGGTNAPYAVVANFGDAAVDALPVELRVDGRTVWTRPVRLPPGGVTNLDLALGGTKPGWHEAEVRLRGEDALAADDIRHAVFHVPEPVRVLVVENRTDVRVYREQSFFVVSALDPHVGTTDAGRGRFVVEQSYPDGVLAKLRARRPGASADAAPYDAVVLPAMKSLPAGTPEALRSFVQRGGGLLLFGGDALTPSRFGAEFAGLLPAQVLAAATRADAEIPWRVGEFDRGDPVFGVFGGEGAGTPAVAEFTLRHAVQALPGTRVLARFDDGAPFVMAASRGSGRVLLVNTSADTAWTDWPKHKSYVPWLCAATAYIAGRPEDHALGAAAEHPTGTEAVIPLGAVAAKGPYTLHTPDGRDSVVVAEAAGRIAIEPRLPGIHSVRDDAGRVLVRFAANVPASESDLATVTAADATARLTRRDDEGTEAVGGLFGDDRNRREFWRLLLMAALALLFVETVLSNRTAA